MRVHRLVARLLALAALVAPLTSVAAESIPDSISRHDAELRSLRSAVEQLTEQIRSMQGAQLQAVGEGGFVFRLLPLRVLGAQYAVFSARYFPESVSGLCKPTLGSLRVEAKTFEMLNAVRVAWSGKRQMVGEMEFIFECDGIRAKSPTKVICKGAVVTKKVTDKDDDVLWIVVLPEQLVEAVAGRGACELRAMTAQEVADSFRVKAE